MGMFATPLRGRSFGASAAVVLLAWFLSPTGRAHASSGHWTPSSPPVDWSGGTTNAVHLMLSPGDGVTHHSRVLWFRGENQTTFLGGEWNWNPGDDGCAAFPSARFTATSPAIGLSGVDLFCTGHAALSDGRILMPGGSDFVTGSYGENRARRYDRGTGSAPSTWGDPGEMVEWRW